MKVISCLLLCTFLVFATRSQPCNALNPFLPHMELKVAGLLRPTPTNSPDAIKNKCEYEWANHKTCCNYGKLMEYVIQDRSNTDKLVLTINSNLDLLRKEYDRFKKIMEATGKIEAIMKNPNLRSLADLVKFFNSHESNDITYWMSSFGNVRIDQVSSKSCILKIKTVRTGSVCSICSGRSSGWFEGAKARFNKDYCESFLTDCKQTLYFLGNYGQRGAAFFQKLHAFNIGGLQFSAKGPGISMAAAKLDEFMGSLAKLKAFGLASDYVNNPTKGVSRLCNAIVTLVHQPFISIIDRMCDLAAKYLSTWNNIAGSIDQKQLSTASNWVHKPRRLQAFAIPGFEGDVKVVDVHAKIDSSYTSFYGATGTSRNENSIKLGAIPLNLTAVLP